MSDLAAPLLCVMRDEAEAFWCFACLMEKLEVGPQALMNSSHISATHPLPCHLIRNACHKLEVWPLATAFLSSSWNVFSALPFSRNCTSQAGGVAFAHESPSISLSCTWRGVAR